MKDHQIHFDPKEVAVCIGLLLAVCLVFGQAIQHEFVNLDDPEYVYENPIVSQGLTVSGVVWAFTQGHKSMWVPLTWISLMIDWELYDVHAGGYHLTNLILHAATAILLFLVLLRMTERFWPCAIVALLFAIHPLRVESVVWITERKDVLSGFFFMLTLLAYIHYVRHRFSVFRYLLVCLPFVMGMLAKPMLVTVPCLLLLLDYWPLGRLGTRGSLSEVPVEILHTSPSLLLRLGHLAIEKIPMFLLALGDCLMTLHVQTAVALENNVQMTLFERVQYAIIAYATYLGHFFYPVGLLVVYPREGLAGHGWRILAAVVLLFLITVVVVWQCRKRPYLFVGWFWYLGMLAPVAGFVQVGITAIADRFTYLPFIGLAIAIVWGISEWCDVSRIRRQAVGVLTGGIFAALMVISAYETYFWRDAETLWLHTLQRAPNNYVAHNNFGSYLVSIGKAEEAQKHFEQALQASPDNAIIHYNFGCLLMNLGRLEEARDHFWKALQSNPDCIDAYIYLGMLLPQLGQEDMAIAFLEKGIEMEPGNAELRFDLAKLLAAKGMDKQADETRRIAKQLSPHYVERQTMLGELLESRGRFLDAARHYQRVVDVLPEDVDARLRLARALASADRKNEAIDQYEAVLKLDPANAEAQEAISTLR